MAPRRRGDDPARRPRCVLRVGRAAARPEPARQGRSRSAAVWCSRRRTRPRRSGCRRACRGGGPAAVPGPDVRRRPLPRVPAARRRGDRRARDFTPLVERISIDEAFLDVAGAIAPLRHAGRDRRARSAGGCATRSGCPISVGVATTKHLAKVASQVAKPDGLVVVEAGHEREFLDPLPVGLLWGVGPAHERGSRRRGIRTIGELAATSPIHLQRLLGQLRARSSASLAANADPRRIETSRRARSVGAQSALGRRAVTDELLPRRCSASSPTASPPACGPTNAPGARSRCGCGSPACARHPLGHPALCDLDDAHAHRAERRSRRTALADHPGEREITLLAISVSEPRRRDSPPARVSARPRRRPAPPGHGRRVGSAGRSTARWTMCEQASGAGPARLATVVFREDGGVPDEFRELAEADGQRSATRAPRPRGGVAASSAGGLPGTRVPSCTPNRVAIGRRWTAGCVRRSRRTGRPGVARDGVTGLELNGSNGMEGSVR